MAVKPENVRVEYRNEVTINLGDYQNIKPGFTLSADVPAGAKPSEVKDILVATLDKWLEDKIAAIEAEEA